MPDACTSVLGADPAVGMAGPESEEEDRPVLSSLSRRPVSRPGADRRPDQSAIDTAHRARSLQDCPRAWHDRARNGPGHPSVSYTHLRAHETRHDLVCRLLLEKKKKKTHKLATARNPPPTRNRPERHRNEP